MDIPVIDNRCQRVMTFFTLLEIANSNPDEIDSTDLEHFATQTHSLWEMGEVTLVCQIWSDLSKNKELFRKATPYIEVTASLLGAWAMKASLTEEEEPVRGRLNLV